MDVKDEHVGPLDELGYSFTSEPYRKFRVKYKGNPEIYLPFCVIFLVSYDIISLDETVELNYQLERLDENKYV